MALFVKSCLIIKQLVNKNSFIPILASKVYFLAWILLILSKGNFYESGIYIYIYFIKDIN